jgi:hypothetical protein
VDLMEFALKASFKSHTFMLKNYPPGQTVSNCEIPEGFN